MCFTNVIYIYTVTNIYTNICIFIIYVYTYKSLSLYIYIYTCIYIYIYIHIMYVCMYTSNSYKEPQTSGTRQEPFDETSGGLTMRGALNTPGSHSKISRYNIFAKGWVAQKTFVL